MCGPQVNVRPTVLKTGLMNGLRSRLTSPIHVLVLCLGGIILNLVDEPNINWFPTLWPVQGFTDYPLEYK